MPPVQIHDSLTAGHPAQVDLNGRLSMKESETAVALARNSLSSIATEQSILYLPHVNLNPNLLAVWEVAHQDVADPLDDLVDSSAEDAPVLTV